jgi:hypothetical protein
MHVDSPFYYHYVRCAHDREAGCKTAFGHPNTAAAWRGRIANPLSGLRQRLSSVLRPAV